MSTGSIGTLGTDDDQEQTAWDDGTLWWSANAVVTGAITEGPVDCSRWGYTILSVTSASKHGVLVLTWSDKATGGVTLAKRAFVIGPTVTNPLQTVIPNMGPWIKGTFTPQSGGGTWQPTIYGLFTNRARPATNYAQGPFIMQASTAPIAASGTAILSPSDYWAGNSSVFILNGSTNISVAVDVMDTAFAFTHMLLPTVNANLNSSISVFLPLGVFRVVLTNLSTTAQNTGVVVTIMPDLVGV